MRTLEESQAIRLSLASPEQIRSWSFGEVTKPTTLNYRTLKPEKDGLLCERIFGPTKDWQCYCGRCSGYEKKGRTCPTCGVEVIRSDVRRERMGHIELAAPVAHVWYYRGSPSYMALLLDLSPRKLVGVLTYSSYIITYVDEDGIRQERARLAEALAALPPPQAGGSAGRSKRGQLSRDGAQTSARSAEQLEVEAGRERELRASVDAERATRAQLREWMGREAGEDILFAPTGQVIVKAGQIVQPLHLGTLEHACEAWRNAIADQARASLALLAESGRAGSGPLGEDAGNQAGGSTAPGEARSRQELEQLQSGLERLQLRALLLEKDYWQLRERWSHLFRAEMGAGAILELLAGLDLEVLADELRAQVLRVSGQHLQKVTRRLRLVEALRQAAISPARMILTALPVLPPALRPVVQMDGGKLASSDLNDLYLRVIARNDRVKTLQKAEAPAVILHNELRLLQEAVDALFDNGRGHRATLGAGALGAHRMKSLAAMLRGKQGRFRENLLGKRVDYSGRSVIVVGPDLKLHQCGLPKKMALELFKPFVMHKLVEQHYCANAKSAKRFVERALPEVWDVLEEVIRDHPVLLNRAPTLHRLGIQAFEAVLVEGSAIQLHPLVCWAFNADFDGDQMAVHVPLSDKAQDEARRLLLSTRNLLSPATGEPSIGASQDMVLGCFYLTQDRPNKKGEGRTFTDATEALLAYEHGIVDLQAAINVRLGDVAVYDQPPPDKASTQAKGKLVQTTVGRIIFNEELPERLRFKNYPMKKENLKQLIAECFRECGRARTAELADEIKRLGFSYATRAGVTIAIADARAPIGKQEVLHEADARIGELEEQYREGLMTESEKYQQSVAIWNDATERVTKMVESSLDPYGSIATIARSGATKAKFQQIRQLSGMRGLMASPSGRIIDVPIRGNFREGLSVLEYFISSHGARKGLADTSLRTAESGHLTRRLVDVAQDVIVTEEDCGTSGGVLITERDSVEMGYDSMLPRLTGRVLADPGKGCPGFPAGTELTPEAVERLLEAGVRSVRVRSPLTCEARRGLCRKCYGHDLATHALVDLGAPVGIIAAQSIGEPGTQLTMRTFHSGGIAGAQGDITQGLPRVEELFEARVPKDKAEISDIDGTVEMGVDEGTGARTVRVLATTDYLDEYPLPAGCQVLVQTGQRVQRGQALALLPCPGGRTTDEVRARTEGEVLGVADDLLTLRFEEREERSYPIPPARSITVTTGQRITAGTPITVGNPDPLAVLRVLGREGVQLYLVREIQKVYRNTGVYIDDKHAEVIVRQMLRRVQVEDRGDSDLLPGELLDRFRYADINASTLAEGGEPATASTVLLGITKASLSTESWLAAASFQETTRVLTRAATFAQVDHLLGLKENVIIGKLIPAGTGWNGRAHSQYPKAHPLPRARTAEAAPEQEEVLYV